MNGHPEFGGVCPWRNLAIKHGVPYDDALALGDSLIHFRGLMPDTAVGQFLEDACSIANWFLVLSGGEKRW